MVNTKPIVLPDGFVIPKVTHTMGGATCPLAVIRYGNRYFLRDLGPSEDGSRCSCSIRADDLRMALDQADADPGTLGDVLWMSIGMEQGGDASAYEDDEDEECDMPAIDTDAPAEPRASRRYIQAKLEGFL